MEEVKNTPEVAAEAAVVNNVAVEATSVEPAVEAATLLEVVLDTTKDSRSRQTKIFGRHWSGSQSLKVIKEGAEEALTKMAEYKVKLEALLQEIAQKEATARLQTVAEGADVLSAEEIQQMIQLLEAAKAAKAS